MSAIPGNYTVQLIQIAALLIFYLPFKSGTPSCRSFCPSCTFSDRPVG